MNSRALLTALLFGSAIAGTRLVAQAPASQTQKPEQAAAADSVQAATEAQDHANAQVRQLGFARSPAGNLPTVGHSTGAVVAGQATAAAIDDAASVDTARSPRCSG